MRLVRDIGPPLSAVPTWLLRGSVCPRKTLDIRIGYAPPSLSPFNPPTAVLTNPNVYLKFSLPPSDLYLERVCLELKPDISEYTFFTHLIAVA